RNIIFAARWYSEVGQVLIIGQEIFEDQGPLGIALSKQTMLLAESAAELSLKTSMPYVLSPSSEAKNKATGRASRTIYSISGYWYLGLIPSQIAPIEISAR